MCHEYTTGQQIEQVPSDVLEHGCADDVGRPDAVDAGDADVSSGVDERDHLLNPLTRVVQQDDTDLDEAIRGRIEPSGLKVDHRIARHGRLLP